MDAVTECLPEYPVCSFPRAMARIKSGNSGIPDSHGGIGHFPVIQTEKMEAPNVGPDRICRKRSLHLIHNNVGSGVRTTVEDDEPARRFQNQSLFVGEVVHTIVKEAPSAVHTGFPPDLFKPRCAVRYNEGTRKNLSDALRPAYP